MSKRARNILLGGVGLLIALVVGGFFLTHERAERTVREPPRGEARKNPNLALERLIQQEGGAVSSSNRLRTPDETAIIVLATAPQLSPQQRKQWREWIVEEGGHLVMPAPPSTEGSEEGLPGELGVELTDEMPDDVEPVRYQIEARAGAGKLSVAPTKPDWLAEDDEGRPFAVSRRVERGRITFLNSSDILRNDSLDRGTHATLIFDVFDLSTDFDIEQWSSLEGLEQPIVSIAQTTRRQSWVAYAANMTWPVFPPLLLIVCFAIIRGWHRFGPLLPDPPAERRSRVEHIEATGRFLAKHGSSAALVEATHNALIRALERSHPGLSSLEPRERNAAAADILGISHEEARRLLRPPTASGSHESFAHRIRQLEEHRRRL